MRRKIFLLLEPVLRTVTHFPDDYFPDDVDRHGGTRGGVRETV